MSRLEEIETEEPGSDNQIIQLPARVLIQMAESTGSDTGSGEVTSVPLNCLWLPRENGGTPPDRNLALDEDVSGYNQDTMLFSHRNAGPLYLRRFGLSATKYCVTLAHRDLAGLFTEGSVLNQGGRKAWIICCLNEDTERDDPNYMLRASYHADDCYIPDKMTLEAVVLTEKETL